MLTCAKSFPDIKYCATERAMNGFDPPPERGEPELTTSTGESQLAHNNTKINCALIANNISHSQARSKNFGKSTNAEHIHFYMNYKTTQLDKYSSLSSYP